MEWTYQQISNATSSVLDTNMGPIKVPLVSQTSSSTKGDASSTVETLYERDAVKKYGLSTGTKTYKAREPARH